MSANDDTATSALQEIERDECFVLVASMSIGRIAVALPGGPPLVVPVNYALDGEVVIFRTDPGTKLDMLREQPVSFQVDLIDPGRRDRGGVPAPSQRGTALWALLEAGRPL